MLIRRVVSHFDEIAGSGWKQTRRHGGFGVLSTPKLKYETLEISRIIQIV